MNDDTTIERRNPTADDASYHKAVMPPPPQPAVTVDELIQTMRLSSLSEVRAGLEKLRKKQPAAFNTICNFYLGLK